MQKPIYLDYHATTPVDPRVFEAMEPYFKDHFCNPASQTHACGLKAGGAVEAARVQVAKLIGADPAEVTFTSGATESNNWCLKGLLEHFDGKKDHLITSAIEHSCVLDTAKYLETRGAKVDFLGVNKCGMIDLEELESKITDRTFLVSIMAVNNEIGTINDYKKIGEICRKKGVFFHTDATQAVGYLGIDVQEDNIDFLSMSSHKIYGPKGIGALYTNKNVGFKLPPLIHGGGHEKGLRSGTVNVPAVVGFGYAAELAQEERNKEIETIKALRDRLWDGLKEKVPGIQLNGHETCRSINNLNVIFKGVEAVDLIRNLQKDVMVSSGSACASGKSSPSHVLKAIGVSDNDSYSNIRFSVGRFTKEEEVDFAINRVAEEALKLQ